MLSNLYGNPHSASNASQLTTRRIEDVRLRPLKLFKADRKEFDIVFVANATAGIKWVMNALRNKKNGSCTDTTGMRIRVSSAYGKLQQNIAASPPMQKSGSGSNNQHKTMQGHAYSRILRSPT